MEQPPYVPQPDHHRPLPTPPPAGSPAGAPSDKALDYDVVVILAAVLCALVCALGLNSMLQCVIRCTRRTLAEPAGWVACWRRPNGGLRKEDVLALPVTTFEGGTGSPAAVPRCAICLADFSVGDKIRVLPQCSHRFHMGCVDTWLLAHCSCPTCRCRLSSHSSGAHCMEMSSTSN